MITTNKRYKDKLSNKTAVIISSNAAGMGNKVIGLTLVIYKYEGDELSYPFVMEHSEFIRSHYEILTGQELELNKK